MTSGLMSNMITVQIGVMALRPTTRMNCFLYYFRDLIAISVESQATTYE